MMTTEEQDATIELLRQAVVQVVIDQSADGLPIEVVVAGITDAMASIAATEAAQGTPMNYSKTADAIRSRFIKFAKPYERQIRDIMDAQGKPAN